jgi:dTDP-4-amino-4,6-dideoxygalactose transaminase
MLTSVIFELMSETQKRIWLSPPHMGGNEQHYVNEAFASNWVAPLGPNVDAFEQTLREATQTKAAAALTSGTAALHLALRVLGIKPGDVVICQSMTFAASAFSITYENAEPVFIDSEPDTWNMDPVLLKDALTELKKEGRKVAAVIVVHLYGMPARMNEILQIANEFDVPVIEDAAEALGSSYFNQPCGSLGNLAILSFNGNKIITTSGGGALIGNDIAKVDEARFLSTQAKEPYPHYEHAVIGFNYRMSNIVAGIGRGQMEVLSERVAKRRANYEFYKGELSVLPGVSFLTEPEGSYSNRWLTTITIDPDKSGGVKREQIRLKLEANNIESRPLWKPMHMQPVFSNARSFVNGISEDLFSKGLCLPSGTAMTEDELHRICMLIKSLWSIE